MAGKKKKTPLNLVPSPSSASPPIFLSTFDRESRYPIFITFCDCLSIADILALTQTCKELSGLYRYLLPIQWDVDKALRHYVDDPKDFRSQMAKYDALIDGTFANEFFERAVCDRDLLSVTIQQGLGPQLFSKYLSDIVGYSEVKLEEFDQNHLTAEVGTYGMLSASAIRAKSYAIADPNLQKGIRQQDCDRFACYQLPTSAKHTVGDQHYGGSQYHKLE